MNTMTNDQIIPSPAPAPAPAPAAPLHATGNTFAQVQTLRMRAARAEGYCAASAVRRRCAAFDRIGRVTTAAAVLVAVVAVLSTLSAILS